VSPGVTMIYASAYALLSVVSASGRCVGLCGADVEK
jgi:hypothetical protein